MEEAWFESVLFYGFSVVFGLVAEFVEVNYGNLFISVLLLLIFTFLLGFSNPRAVWRWALVAGIWIPVFSVLDLVLIVENFTFVSLFAPFLVLIPSFIGAYMGKTLKENPIKKNKRKR